MCALLRSVVCCVGWCALCCALLCTVWARYAVGCVGWCALCCALRWAVWTDVRSAVARDVLDPAQHPWACCWLCVVLGPREACKAG
mmetsp:Transcript_22942/g.57034  ORF Transcript_22942/g.57034 Transcript_22942/m.57034 type:complete len:86 (-) Transcript_22942:77-334(-)